MLLREPPLFARRPRQLSFLAAALPAEQRYLPLEQSAESSSSRLPAEEASPYCGEWSLPCPISPTLPQDLVSQAQTARGLRLAKKCTRGRQIEAVHDRAQRSLQQAKTEQW